MNKFISRFRIEPYGLFIDLAEENGRIGVDPRTGNIFLDEGNGPDRFHGAVIRAREFREIKLVLAKDSQTRRVILHFGNGRTHDLGGTADVDAAAQWAEEASRAIRASLDQNGVDIVHSLAGT